ncbi:membrane protein insertase YidC [Aquabacterium sp. J223]|uniref:membrane protein insertase YidC n=1 Tax=Aquabacterium sp. J223 TaxID=2898431 RepID=UPI0021AD56D4|nr:membrane protein insertase YidC [Aquabacterium sp. J223]UUX96124.1 membrane protein insertase YidC [Aquabacterium sp. J223]
MTDIRRTVLWMVFVTSLLFLWDGWNKHNGRPSLFSPPPPKPAATAPADPAATPSASALPTPSTAAPPTATPAQAPTASSSAGDPASWVTLTTDVVKASFDPRGGDVVRVELLQQRDLEDERRHVVLLDRSAQRFYVAQTGLVGAPAGQQWPNHLTPMTPVAGPRELADGQTALTLTFESAEVGGLKLRKTYTLARGAYTFGVKHEVVNASSQPATPQLYLQLVRDGNPPPGESSFYSTFTGPAIYTDATKFAKLDFKDIEKGKAELPKPGTDGWVAMVQHYFAAAWLPPANQPREFYARKVDTNLYAVGMLLPVGTLPPGATATQEATLFVGPQEEKKLEALAPGLELVKDYGWFTILSKPLFWLLDHLHTLIGNWGWAIVALVVLLKVAFYWLNASAYRSMAKMKAVNPRIMEMRERLKDKPQQMQQEMMRIYREEKINPLGGCLPIFIQMPFFIALYWVLLSSVEMRNAPWIGWVTDLSARDPFFILPLLMTATSLLQVWLNPTPPDPVQARMMWIMPLVFSVMFFFFPAGLVLYWLTNNTLSIAQQYLINRQLGVNK